ncbi:MAG: leucyl aminopeptidase family protein [Rudaea sp.]|nr:leucyl aminopeptidase family protein [Rudaea sp.]
MHGLIESSRSSGAIGLIAVDRGNLARVARKLGQDAERWIAASGFRGDPGSFCLVPDAQGHAQCVFVGISRRDDIFALAALPQRLPAGKYRIDASGIALDAQCAALGWGLAAYQFARYRRAVREPARLVVDRATARAVLPRLEAIYRVRNLVNTPTQDMGPAELAAEVRQLAKAHGAKYRDWVGPQLLKANFPTIHAVGRASHREPRLIELRWGKARDPHLVLVGKGVCFDTGGLDLKTSDGMRWMKKDMGGAAHAIALAGLIMQAKLPVRLSLLVPAVENAIGGNAYRPGEVIRTRAGITVEVDNTDAEGRLVLCDALAYASEQKPDLIIDFATLTGAARVALGPELPALFANRDDLAAAVLRSGQSEQDALWRMPLWQPYAAMLDSRIADIGNAGSSRQAGAITAALYLQRFVPETQAWMHVDQYAWNDADRPGRPHGGEAQGLRAFFAWLNRRYAPRPDDAGA